MANSVSSRKRVRQNLAERSVNRWRLRTMREAIKGFESTLAGGDLSEAKKSYQAACSIIDRTAQKGVIHVKQAARRKSRLNARLKAKAAG
jgi:small subunit ribosomal protein S20